MTITIFGATGFIGKELVKYLLQKDYFINIITRNKLNSEKIFNQSVKLYDYDFENLLELINKTEIIINLAGENISSGLWTKKQKQKILTSRINIGNLISKLCVKATNKPKLLIQASAIGYYGNHTKNSCTEHSLKGAGFLADVCEQWEKSTENVSNLGIHKVIIRTGIVFGKQSGILPKLLLQFRFYFGINLGKGNNNLSWIHIEDEIRAIEFIINNQHLTGIYNLTAPEPVKMKIINEIISKKLNRPIFISIPDVLLNLLLGDISKEMLLSNQQVLPNRLLNEGFHFNFKTIDSALSDLLN